MPDFIAHNQTYMFWIAMIIFYAWCEILIRYIFGKFAIFPIFTVAAGIIIGSILLYVIFNVFMVIWPLILLAIAIVTPTYLKIKVEKYDEKKKKLEKTAS